jgi:hypothetical protein
MAQHYRRDLIGHFIRKEQHTQRPCTHACCRGYRVHPANYPVILASRTLHRASDEDLGQHFDKVSRENSPKARRAEAQILHEMERRDRIEMARRERAAARTASQQRHRDIVAADRAAARMDREAEDQRIRLEVEERTKGYLVNPQGRARGISDEEILTGREEVFIRYATREAKEYFTTRPRPTAAYYRGRDTRVPYSDRPSRPRSRRRSAFTRRSAGPARRVKAA